MDNHRPWPLPERPWTMTQIWHELLFAHWPLPPERLRPLVPAVLPLDTFDGQAWIGVVPFGLRGARPRFIPPFPWLSAFPELNVRAYVTLDGKPGVYFFSLDAANALAVATARLWFKLPYFNARMTLSRRDGAIHYRSRRVHPGSRPATFQGVYRPTGDVFHAARGSLDDWLTSRYCLYTVDDRRRVHRLEIDHPLWPLQPAELHTGVNTMTAPLGLALPDVPPLLRFSQRLEVHFWPRERVR